MLPDFLSVIFDPTRHTMAGMDLNGWYDYDDEGVKARPVTAVENGVLKTFLMSRSPIAGFDHSNGHGRRQPGYEVVSRQSNLIVESAKAVSDARLREMLIEEIKRQNKPYGLYFRDITGGFTTTSRAGLQAFKVIPVIVYRVYADGRPDELVRGADIVGTPLASFAKILATGDKPEVFNGYCGAESRQRAGFRGVAGNPGIGNRNRKEGQSERPAAAAPRAGDAREGGRTVKRLMLAAAAAALAALAADAPAPDPVLAAMRDEIARAGKLTVSNLDAPYFVQYVIDQGDAFTVSASLGGLLARRRDQSGSRRSACGWATTSSTTRTSPAAWAARAMTWDGWPLDDSYPVLRRYLWLATDSAYKSAVETISRKRAALRNLTESNPADDFSHAQPVRVYPRAGPPGDRRERLGRRGCARCPPYSPNIPGCWTRAWSWRPRPAATTW